MEWTERRQLSEIPTSSMADVAFLLLIYFLVSTTFAATRGLDFTFPERDDSRPVEPVESVLVEVQGADVLVVDGRPMPLADLLAYLHPKLERDPSKPVIVKAESAAPYGALVDVLDELRQARDRLGLVQDVTIALPTEREAAQFWP